MGIEWFRSWHGAPTDPKWLMIAKRSETQPGIVSAIVWALLDYASQNGDDRGAVEGFDIETYAAFSGFAEETIAAVIACLKDKNIIVDGHLAAWDKRQPKREDNSTERVRAHRNAMKRSETHGNAPDKDKEEDKEEEKEQITPVANATGQPARLSRKRPKRTMPAIFPMTDKNRAYANDAGFAQTAADGLFSRFKNHHLANGTMFSDWDAAWRKWVDNEVKFNRGKFGQHPRSDDEIYRGAL